MRAKRRPVVALVTDAVFPYHRGGKEVRYHELARRLTAYAEVHVYTMKWWQGRSVRREGGVTYHAICPLLPLYAGKRRSIPQAVIFALACLRLLTTRFDVIEADHMPYIQLFSLRLVANLRRKRLVVTWHECWGPAYWRTYLGDAGRVGWWFERSAMRLPDAIIAASPETAERLRRSVGPNVTVTVAPNGVDLAGIRGVPPASEHADLVVVSRLLEHKRIDLLLDTVALLRGDGLSLSCRIIGDGPERQALHRQAAALGIADVVDFRHDVVGRDELYSLLKASRVFVFPSAREGFGMAVLEAMACGLPVVTTSAPDNLARHLVARSTQGIVCSATVPTLAAAVKHVLATHDDVRAPEAWVGEFDWDAVTDCVADVMLSAPTAVGVAPRALGPSAARPDLPERVDAMAAKTTFSPPSPRREAPHPVATAATTRMHERRHPPRADDRAGMRLDPSGRRPDSQDEWSGRGEPAVHDDPALREAATVVAVPPAARSRSRSILAPLVARAIVLALIAALSTAARDHWPAQTVLLALLLTVPGLLLLRALRVPGRAVTAFPIYVPCASLLVLFASGLAVDLLGGAFVSDPLRKVPLLIGLEATCLVLLVAGMTASAHLNVPWRTLRPAVRYAWPLLLPALSAVGALRLTNGHGNLVAIVAMCAAAATLFVATVFAGRTSRAQLSFVLYGVALAAIWSFTLRGRFVYGYDISSEYHVLTATYGAGVWTTVHHNDAYGAMLSLTVLPSLLHALAGVPALVLLKAVYPALFALFPVALFGLAQRLLRLQYAFIAAAFIVVQSYFFQQMPAIARQEIALLLFVALVAAVLDRRLPKGSHWTLVALLGLGIVVSHYATTYLTIAFFGAALVLQLPVSRFRRLPAFTPAVLAAVLATGAGAAVWYGAVTHSSSNLASFTTSVRDHGLDLLPNAKPGQNLVETYLEGNLPRRVRAGHYERLVVDNYAKQRRYVRPLPSATEPRYAVHNSTVRADVERPGIVLSMLRAAQLVISQLANLLAVIGVIALLLWRRTGPVARRLGLLGASTLVVLAFVRLSGTAANSYNQERAFVQTMVPLGIGMAWLLQAIALRSTSVRLPRGVRRARRLIPSVGVLAALALGVLFVTNSGLRGIAVGGGTPTNLANRGEDYERYYVTEPELAAANWLARVPGRALTYADRYGQLRLLAATGHAEGLLPDITPETLDRHAWVYASRTNILQHRARGDVGNQYATYTWPALFLAQNFNTVYSNGSSRVYNRPIQIRHVVRQMQTDGQGRGGGNP